MDFPGGSVVQETQVQSLGREFPLEGKTAIHASIFAWETPMDKGQTVAGYSTWNRKS